MLDPAIRPKSMFMLTATPINNRLADFRHMAELFTRRDEAYFGRTLGVRNLRAHFNNLERSLQKKLGVDVPDASEHLTEAQEILAADRTFREVVVQRSRAYARESQIRETGISAVFPERKPPQVAEYSIRKTYGRLLDIFDQAFQRANPLFTLPIYYPLHWYHGEDKSIDPLEEGRQKQVVGLIRTMFLKRSASPVRAFELSCHRLLKKLLAFLEVHSETDSEKKLLDRWKRQNAEILDYVAQRQFEVWGEDGDEEPDEDVVPQELLDAVDRLDRKEYNVVEMINETYLDLGNLVKFLDESRKFEPKHDDKLKKLIRLLKSKELADRKVLIFTEFADTARYLYRELVGAGIDGLAQMDSASGGNRATVIRRFAPYYNGSSSEDLAARGESEIRVLISTDVLSEGLNLQDACRMINYDIHWNPVRLMQRIGRVDRRMNLEIEKRFVADHPEVESSRGKVAFWNFLPPDELNVILTLYTRVTQKTLLISRTLGIEGRKLLTPEDDYEALKEFNHAYEGTRSVIEEMHLEYQDMIAGDQDLLARLERLPGAIFSGRERPRKGVRGLFLCYALPAFDKERGEFTEAAGTARWYLEIRSRVEKHIKNTYLKRVDAPVGVRPSLKCWMELNEG
jgi:SNF2 family DNA or RNA helicase